MRRGRTGAVDLRENVGIRRLTSPEHLRHLDRPPIREAILDFRSLVPEHDAETRIRTVCESWADGYPERTPIHHVEGQIRFDDHGVASQHQGASRQGYRLKSRCGRNVVQIRRDGFTFSRLQPYRSWDAMVRDAWPLWEHFVTELQPVGVSRVATRFINALPVAPGQPLGQVVTAPPVVPPGMPTAVSAFLFRYLTLPTDGITSSVCMATEAPDSNSLVLDIDCAVSGDFSATAAGLAEIRHVLDRLRERKNDVFFASVTKEAVARWK